MVEGLQQELSTNSVQPCQRWRRQRHQPIPQLPAVLEDSSALLGYARASAKRHENVNLASLLELPPEQRMQALAELRAQSVASEMRAEGKCERCMMQDKYCICCAIAKILQPLPRDSRGRACAVRFVVWMHHKERRRASNTGKLLQLVLPECAEVLTHGVAADEARLQELARQSAGRTFVLFPSEDAVTAAEAFGTSAPTKPAAEGESTPVAVLIDGTWNQAQRMHKHFQDLPHVMVTPTAASQFHWRRQSQEDRISTVEAAALLLEEIGDAQDASEALRRGLAELMDALGRQCHHDTLTAQMLPEPTGKKKLALGAKKMQKLAPGARSKMQQPGDM